MAKRHRRKRQRTGDGSDPQLPIPPAQEPGEDGSRGTFVLESEPMPQASRAEPAPDGSAEGVGEADSIDRADIGHEPAPVLPEKPPQPESLDELLAAGEYRRALPLVEISLEERPDDVELLLVAGRVYSEVGNYDRAQLHLDQARELAPDEIRVRREAGIALFKRGLYAEAAETLSVVCARSEGDGEAYYYRGEALNRSGQSEDAARAMAKAASLAPHDERPLLSLGRIYDRMGMVDEAAEMYSKARQVAKQAGGAAGA